MAQISQSETADLLSKLFTERTPLQAFLFADSGTRISFWGFIDSITRDNGVVISASGPPMDVSKGYVNFNPFKENCDFWYGEKRELPPEMLAGLEHARGDSCLLFVMRGSFGRERIGLYFNV